MTSRSTHAAAELKAGERRTEHARSTLWRDFVDPAFSSELRADVAAHVAPFADEIDRDDVYPLHAIKALARKGYATVTLPRQFGGGGGDFSRCIAVFEEASFASAAVGISLITILQAQKIIELFAAESLKKVVLPEFPDGLVTSYALTEANHGSDIRSLDTKARKVRDGWILNGRKSFITSGSAAEAYIILAETDVGVSCFFVRRSMAGVSTEQGRNATTFGLRNGPHVDLVLNDLHLPADHLIGIEGKGVRQAVTTLDFSRAAAAAISIGIARAAFEGALAFASKRVAFDRNIIEFQGIQWYFADMMAEIDGARLLVYEAARALDEHRDIARYSSEAKLVASRVATETASRCVQICGAYGVTEAAPFGRYLRDAKAYEIAGGSSEVLKNTIAKYLRQFGGAGDSAAH
jgi:alkylation response protein AidB-like acyl-CoA dehydrogenase